MRLPTSLLVTFLTCFFAGNIAKAADFTVTAASTELAYTINGTGGNPALTLVRGQTYSFDIDACPCHPFQIDGAPPGSVVNNNIFSGTLYFTVPLDDVNYHYICSIHRFGGNITSAAPPPPPSVTTQAASSIGSTTATLNGSVNPNGQTTLASFVYGTDPTLATGTQTTVGQDLGNGSTGLPLTAAITGLQPSTTYYFRARASSSGGTAPGSILSFPTLSNNADLSNLVLGSGTLSPVFVSTTASYAATVPNATASITVTPTVSQANASITVNGTTATSGAGSSVSLNTGPNVITIHVTAQDATTSQDYVLTVTRQTRLDEWRQTYFPGSTASTGPGADTAIPQNDGICNLIKFATGMDPSKSGTMPGTVSKSGANLTFTYTPSATAVADGVTFAVEYSDTLNAVSWLSDVVNQGALGAGGAPVTAIVPNGSGSQRFLHLKIAVP